MAILAECPVCRKVQSKKNKTCACGANLERLKKQKEKVKYYIVYRVNGKLKWELPDDPYSMDSAEACLGKRTVQKKEKHILDIEPEWNITFSQLAEWYTGRLEGAHEARRLRSLPTLKLYLNKFNQKFGNRSLETSLSAISPLRTSKTCSLNGKPRGTAPRQFRMK